MTHRLDAHELANCALKLKPVGVCNYHVLLGSVTVGEIMERRRSFGRRVWFWSLSGEKLPETMKVAGSNAHTLEGAKRAVKAEFDTWLELTTGRRGDVSWERSDPSA